MVWRFFRRSSTRPVRDDVWWNEAERLADALETDGLTRLRASMRPEVSDDDAEQQEEMMDGLEQLAAVARETALPVITTQHRVIGTDTCHLALPSTLSGEHAVPGKVFLTAQRMVFAGGRATSWPWHRVRATSRNGRMVSLVMAGPSEAVQLHCNSYGDALLITYLSRRLTSRPGPDHDTHT